MGAKKINISNDFNDILNQLHVVREKIALLQNRINEKDASCKVVKLIDVAGKKLDDILNNQ